jgi:hypothetical protein
MRLIIADAVWPAILLEGRILTWWAILAGLVVEYLFVLRIGNLPPLRAALADLAMNAASTMLGIVLIPLFGLLWEFFPGLVMYKMFRIGTFNPATWTATIVMAAAINTFVERYVLRRFYRQPCAGKRGFLLLFFANAISVGLAFGSLMFYPPKA